MKYLKKKVINFYYAHTTITERFVFICVVVVYCFFLTLLGPAATWIIKKIFSGYSEK